MSNTHNDLADFGRNVVMTKAERRVLPSGALQLEKVSFLVMCGLHLNYAFLKYTYNGFCGAIHLLEPQLRKT